MGSLEELQGKRVYLDANIVIYLLEQPNAIKTKILALAEAIAAGAVTCVTAELTVTEVLAGAAKHRGQEAADACIEFFESGAVVELHASSRDAFYKAGLLRTALNLKTPDALHIASALDARCGVFLTNDKRLKAPEGLVVVRFCDL